MRTISALIRALNHRQEAKIVVAPPDTIVPQTGI